MKKGKTKARGTSLNLPGRLLEVLQKLLIPHAEGRNQ